MPNGDKHRKGIKAIFGSLKDHRVDRKKLHSLENLVFISIAAVITGAKTWHDIERFGHVRREWLERYLDLSNGIPSHDTFNRFFTYLDPAAFESCFREWVATIINSIYGDVISIDGKTVRGSRDINHSPLHIVSAWSSLNQLSLGQIATANKSNEITAIPELLESLLLEDNIITIDAIGCQTNIADIIIEKGGDYVLAVKANQKTLLQDVIDSFRFLNPSDSDTTNDFGHGRIEVRKCDVITDLSMLSTSSSWVGLKSIVRVESTRHIKATDQSESSVRYYITSLQVTAKQLNQAVRSHWGIENNLHWMLDVGFSEDAMRKRNRNAVQNFSLLTKIALSLLKRDTTSTLGIPSKQYNAALDPDYLIHIMGLATT